MHLHESSFSDNTLSFHVEEFYQLLMVAMGIDSATGFPTAYGERHPAYPTKRTASASVRSDSVCRIYPRFIAFGMLKIYP